MPSRELERMMIVMPSFTKCYGRYPPDSPGTQLINYYLLLLVFNEKSMYSIRHYPLFLEKSCVFQALVPHVWQTEFTRKVPWYRATVATP